MSTDTPTTPASATPASATAAPTGQDLAARREEFEKAVSGHRRKGARSSADKLLVVLGAVLMAAGVIGAFVQYNVTLSQDDARDIASSQVRATALLAVAVVGVGLFVAGFLARVLRLWLLRQLLENQARDERLADLAASSAGRIR